MTSKEQMVWAAAYSARLMDLHKFRSEFGYPEHQSSKNGRQEAELDDTAVAVEWAWAAVERMREVMPRVREGWGDDSDVTKMLAQMTF